MMEKVVFLNRTSDGKLVSWSLNAQQFKYIMDEYFNWTQLFNYLNSIQQSEEVKE